jgi:hypothetical protein
MVRVNNTNGITQGVSYVMELTVVVNFLGYFIRTVSINKSHILDGCGAMAFYKSRKRTL